jgi:lysophospholipase L1-like esterase
VGRFDRSDPTGPQFTWSGTAFRTRVDGAPLEITVAGAAGVFFQVIVDDSPSSVFETLGGEQVHTVADGLAAGPHDVEIYRRNEGFFGTVQLLDVAAGSGGQLVETPRPWQRRIEFIGDSITCGYGVEGPDEHCSFSGDTETAYATYAAIAARELDAEAHLIAYSGKGVFQNYGGDTNEPMPELYGRTLTGDSTDTWDFASWTADAVVVNLGTNDFSATIAQNQFVPAYAALLGTIRSQYPSARIFCVSWAHWGSEHESWVEDAMTQSGDDNLTHLGFTIETSEGWGCDYHPSAATHQRLGQELAQAMRTAMGW